VSYTLQGARDKLRWAKHHFEILRPQIEAFEQRDKHTISVEIDADEGKYTFHVHGLEPVDPDWGLMIGDCVHNARTALDHLMVQLYARITGKDPREVTSVQFPISDTPEKFRDAPSVREAMKHLHFSGYLARIEELQPYNALNGSVWRLIDEQFRRAPPVGSSLAELSRLDIIDKHRVVHAMWTSVSVGAFTAPDPWPSEFKHIAGGFTGLPLKNDAEVGSWQFQTPLPYEWKPSEMDMKRSFPIEVAFDQKFIGGQPVLVILPLCLWVVEAVLGLFEPVSARKAPHSR
jgi:hypothetical protein